MTGAYIDLNRRPRTVYASLQAARFVPRFDPQNLSAPTDPMHPTAITLHQTSRVLEIAFDDGRTFRLPYEYLRVYSPSAEVRGHGPGPGDAAGRQARRRDRERRVGRPLRDPPEVLRRPHERHLHVGLPLRPRRAAGRAVAALSRPPRCRQRVARTAPDRSAPMTDPVDFGYERVSPDEKTRRVRGVFDSVAGKYDLMNDLMSGGLHRLWKRYAVGVRRRARRRARARPRRRHRRPRAAVRATRRARPGASCSPTSTARCSPKAATSCSTPACCSPVVQCDAETLPFPDRSFDVVSIGFGLRNVTRKERALAEMRRVLRARRRRAGARVLEGRRAAGAGLRLVLVQRAAAARPAGRRRRGELSLPRRVDPHAPRPGDAQGG